MNVNDLTISEMEEIEDATGMPFGDILDPEKPRSGLLKHLAFVLKRKEDPNFTLAQAGQMKMEEITDLLTGDDDESKS